MKKVLFSLFFMGALIVGASAQKAECSKPCGSKTASTSCQAKATGNASVDEAAAAAKLASMDPTIQSHTCPVSGTVSYQRKEAQKDGSVKFVDLKYDASSNTFVNTSPSAMPGKEGCTGQASGSSASKSCCAGKASATSAKSGACCAGKSQKSASKSN